MELLGTIGFAVVKWRSRRRLRGTSKGAGVADAKQGALRVGVNGETYAYWYLGGFDGETLAFGRFAQGNSPAERQRLLNLVLRVESTRCRFARRIAFFASGILANARMRFDVAAIDNAPGKLPLVRLYTHVLSPRV
jgi:hypothetical protein